MYGQTVWLMADKLVKLVRNSYEAEGMVSKVLHGHSNGGGGQFTHVMEDNWWPGLPMWHCHTVYQLSTDTRQDKHDDKHVFANRPHHPSKENKPLRIKRNNRDKITLQGSTVEEVEAFTHIGSTVDKQGGTDGDVKARIAFLHLMNSRIPKPLAPTPRPGQALQV